MKLNNDTLDAIKNRRYQLRPVRRNSVQKKRRLSESAWDVRDVGMGDIAQILSRRISMGYSTIEEDTVSVKSFNSIRCVICCDITLHYYNLCNYQVKWILGKSRLEND